MELKQTNNDAVGFCDVALGRLLGTGLYILYGLQLEGTFTSTLYYFYLIDGVSLGIVSISSVY